MMPCELVWASSGADLTIAPDEVHVHGASLDLPPSELERRRSTLSSDEVARAERFLREQDRAHFIAARGLLRVILGRYLLREPGELRFRYGEHGKPDLAAAERLPLRFNVAHSGELVLVAVTCDRAIGVDLEVRRDSVEWEPIAAEFFSA